MYKLLFDNIFKCTDMLDLAKNLQRMNEFLRHSHEENNIYHLFYSDIAKVASKYNNRINILSDNDWIAPYLLHQLNCEIWCIPDSEAWYEKLNAISNYILHTYEKAQGKIISPSRAYEFLKIVEEKYGFISKHKQKSIDIFIVNNRMAKYNALYNFRIDLYGEVDDCIVLPYTRDEEDYSPEYIFLHELGHLLHTRLTKKQDAAPVSFEYWEKQLFSRNEDDKNDHTHAEIFCDCFAVAALYGTQYEKHILFDRIKPCHKEILTNYFHMLINTLDRNPYGALSWDEIQEIYVRQNKEQG